MSKSIGPCDGRRLRKKRCTACAKRKIKCNGGPSCLNCERANRLCVTENQFGPSDFVFVGQKANDPPFVLRMAKNMNIVNLPLPGSIDPMGFERDTGYFFNVFLLMNVLWSDDLPMQGELQHMMHYSSALRDATSAVAVLHRSLFGQMGGEKTASRQERVVALQLYSESVRSIREQILHNNSTGDASTLWTTFLLGIFELMCDSSGKRWRSHFVHGTCQLLRLQSPAVLTTQGPHNSLIRKFFLATRIFEIARALIYSEVTFLSQPMWKDGLAKLRKAGDAASWHPKEALFDLLPSCSDLSIRALNFCESEVAVLPEKARIEQIQVLAAEGLSLQQSLQEWWEVSNMWEFALNSKGPDLLLAYVYYHAISIYLSGTFDYHLHWTSPTTTRAPILGGKDIEWHMRQILRLSSELLNYGVAGVLLFFPLRVAGARAREAGDREDILQLLGTVTRRGYVVATAFTDDLSALWRMPK